MTTKTPLTIVLVVAMTATTMAGTLNIGDPAPKLVVDEWILGGPVKVPAANGEYVTVVEFWATWCGPCVASIPHTTALQKHYRDKGVKVIGFTSEDPSNTLSTVRKFVREHRSEIDYAIAYEKTETAYNAWVTASGEQGIPTAFIVDRLGRVAWIGHPMDGMEEAVSQIVAGTYDIKVARQIADIRRSLATADDKKRTELLSRWALLAPNDPAPHMETVYEFLWTIGAPSKESETKAIVAAGKAMDAAQRRGPRKMLELGQVFAMPDLPAGFRQLAVRAVDGTSTIALDDTDALITRVELLSLLERDAEALTLARSITGKTAVDHAATARLAQALASTDRPGAHNTLALDLIGQVVAAEPENQQHLQSMFFIKAFAAQERSGISALGGKIIQSAKENASYLNGFAWMILEQKRENPDATRVALAAAREADRLSGSKDWSILDTLALALFKTGDKAGAIATQERAIKECPFPDTPPDMLDRLKQYKAG